MTHRRRLPALAFVILALWSRPAGAADVPRWLADAARRPIADTDRDADAVVIHDEERIAVQADGRRTWRRFFAVRVQTRGGAPAATMQEVYRVGSGDVRSLNAWLLDGPRIIQLGKKETVDRALVSNDVYNETRLRTISAASQIAPGMVFGGESETIESTVFSQIQWRLQSRWSSHGVRRSLILPAGWNVEAATINYPPITAAKEGSTYTWTIAELPAPTQEPSGPSDSLVPRLAVTYFGPSRSQSAFDSWESVGRWLAALQDPQAKASPALISKARELTAGAAGELDRIRAIGAFAQQVQYISIQTGIGIGGGYVPHAATDVLAKNYGDCKDKANLMRALLATLGTPSFLVAVYAGDADFVREEWPSPQQFDHAILAIPIARGTKLPAVAEDESGAFLFFDPTDPFTPVGQLPRHLQNSLGLIVSPVESRLRRLPSVPPDTNVRERTLELSLQTDGRYSARLRTGATGTVAARERATFASLPGDGYTRRVEAELRARLPEAMVNDGAVTDTRDGRFEFAGAMQGRVAGLATGNALVLPPPLPPGDALPVVRAGSRTTPVVLESRVSRDRAELTLPAGAVIADLPAPQALETSFGSFDVRWTKDGSKLVWTSSLRVNRAVVPVVDYEALRRFVDRFRAAERQAIALKLR